MRRMQSHSLYTVHVHNALPGYQALPYVRTVHTPMRCSMLQGSNSCACNTRMLPVTSAHTTLATACGCQALAHWPVPLVPETM